MNAETNLTAVLAREPFDDAQRRVNEWRGRCLDAFARAEAAVTECLLEMSAIAERGATVSLPHLVGQRYAALRNLVAPNGPFALEGKKLAAALIRFQDHDALRPMLCHGLAEVTLDVKGRWMLVLRVVTLRARKAERSVRVLREDEADHLRLTIVRGAHELCQNVTNFRARLVLQPTP